VNEKVQPTLKIVSDINPDRVFTWNASTGKIISDSGWTYSIQDSIESTMNAAISRRNEKDQSEYWFYDAGKGEETTEGVNAIRTIRNWFLRGPATGKVRTVEEYPHDQTPVEVFRASYDEQGRVIREKTPLAINVYTYDQKHGKVLTRYSVDGSKILGTIAYDHFDRISSAVDTNGRTVQYLYDEQGRQFEMLINGHVHSKTTYAADGRSEKTEVYDDSDVTRIARVFYREFDENGRVSLDQYIERLINPGEITKRYRYDALGRLASEANSRLGTFHYTYSLKDSQFKQ
jgi:YD repeat-containing protein